MRQVLGVFKDISFLRGSGQEGLHSGSTGLSLPLQGGLLRTEQDKSIQVKHHLKRMLCKVFNRMSVCSQPFITGEGGEDYRALF